MNRELRGQLARYLKTPDVIVRVLSYQGQRYSVQGNVMKGGQFYLNDQPVSVYTALGMAGGVNAQQGDNASMTLVRQGRSYQLNTVELEKQACHCTTYSSSRMTPCMSITVKTKKFM